MDIRFTLQAQYSGSTFVAGPFNLSGTTDANITYELATNVPKSSLLTGHTVTTPYNITGGTIGSLGVCLNTENYVLTFSPGPIVVGHFTAYSGFSKNGIVKMNNSGTTDNTFNVGTGFNLSYTLNGLLGINTGPTSIALQNDGKVIVGGLFKKYNELTYYDLIRLNPDGSKDYTFSGVSTQTLFSGNTIMTVVSLPDGKMYVGGCMGEVVTGTTTPFLYRLNNDGSKDNSFVFNQFGAGFTGTVKVVTPITSGNILVGGSFSSPTGLIKLSSTGVRDTLWPGFLFNGTNDLNLIECMVVDSADRIMIGGSFSNYAGQSVTPPIRITTSGALDSSWKPNCSGGRVTSIIEDNSQNVYIAGFFTAVSGITKNGLVRITPLGVLDPTFSGSSGFTFANISPTAPIWFAGPKIKILSDGNILAAGPMLTYNSVPTYGFVKISSINGALIPSGFTNSGEPYTVANYCGMICI